MPGVPHLLHLCPHLLHLELVGGDGGGSAQDNAVAPLHRARAPGLGGAGGPHVAGPRLTVGDVNVASLF